MEWNTSSLQLPELSESDCVKLKTQDSRGMVSSFKQKKLQQEAAKNWDKFYKRNETKFYKDRHWTTREFEDLISLSETREQRKLLEIGCGVGNFLYPLLDAGLNWFVYACDFSPRAIDFVKANTLYDDTKVKAFVHDITRDNLLENVPEGSVDIASLIFVLSAIAPEHHLAAVTSIRPCLRSGGAVILRDYGRYDVAQLRFRAGQKLADNFYVRQDGTRAYYFTTEELSRLFAAAGFRTESCHYVTRRTVNKKEGIDVRRTFVQGKFVKDDTAVVDD